MAVIPSSEVKNLFTKALVAIYKERIRPTSFLRSFFNVKETLSRFISIEVQRGTEKVAVDVLRGSKGNRNETSLATEKIISPPYYREYFDLTALSVYDNVFGVDGNVSENAFALLLEAVRDKMNDLIDKIERAYELQCSQVFETGIVTIAEGTNIDFKRKAASLVDNTATPWTTGTNDPILQLQNGAKFIRETGKSTGANVNIILGSQAMNALLRNDIFQKMSDVKNFGLGVVNMPQRNSVGASYHGRITLGSYTGDLWTYPQVYESPAGVVTPYIHEKKVIIVPEVTNFLLSFAGVPGLVNGKPTPLKGQYHFGEYPDERNHNVDYDVRSAGVAVPLAIDQIYTMQVIA